MKCFYHNDNDGRCAGFWVRYFTKEVNPDDYIALEHGMSFPLDIVSDGETVFILDYSITIKEMEELLSKTENVIWIDHHITAINKYQGYNRNIKGIRKEGIAGCQLTYAYFIQKGKLSLEEICENAPLFSKLIGDYDIWQFRYGNETKFFNLSFPIAPPTDSIYDKMLDDSTIVSDIVEKGKIIKSYREELNKSICGGIGHEVDFYGFKCFAVNQCFCNSAFFESVSDYDLYISYFYNGKYWSYTLFSNKVNVGEIAQIYPGGGGHKNAAGFETKEFLFQNLE